jgi:DNA polymerase
VPIIAFNSAFERYVFQYVLGIEIPAERFQDPQASARYLSLPANLEDVGMVLGLPMEMRKDKRGERLLDLFSYPHTRKKKDGGGTYFNDWNTHPAEWAQLLEYCKQDVIAEQEVARRENLLGVFPLPDRERKIWLLDQKINDKGIKVSGLVEKALRLAEKAKQEKLDEQNKATGLLNANSTSQLLPWVRDLGYPLGNLRKTNIELVLKDPEVTLTPECRKVLEARLEAGSTSYKKLQAILRNTSPDGRLRGQFIFMGSSRCGRWSGNSVQLHNLARSGMLGGYNFEELEVMKDSRSMIFAEDYDAIKNKYGSVLLTVKNLIRTFFSCEGTDKKFLIADLASIETRVAAWLSQCGPLLKVFQEGRDAYLDFASKLYGIPYEVLWSDYKGKNGKDRQIAAKRMRQTAKPGVLGAVYQLGGGKWGIDFKTGDRTRTGLFGYSWNMGIEITEGQAYDIVKVFRESYKEIPEMWFDLENAVKDVIQNKQTVRYLGPNNCIKIDKLTIEGRKPLLRIQLPSGRFLHYVDAAIETVKMPWTKKSEETGEEEDVYRPGITYYNQNQTTHQWDLAVTHGGKIFENLCQALARDILTEGMLAVDQAEADIVAHVHDEIVCEVIDDPFSLSIEEMIKIMSRDICWAPGLPLGADGFQAEFYHK